MNWITDNVAIGNFLDAQDEALLRKERINSVLGLIGTLRGVDPATLGVKEIEVIPLIDGDGNDVPAFVAAVDALGRLVREAPPVLVHCHAGRSRAPTVVAAHLMMTSSLNVEEAVARVAARRDLFIVPELLDLLRRFEEKERVR